MKIKTGTDLILNKNFIEFFSGALRKTHSTCKKNVHWCINNQARVGTNFDFKQNFFLSFGRSGVFSSHKD